MKFFSTKQCVLLFVFLVFIAPGSDSQKEFEGEVVSTKKSNFRVEVESTIDKAMELGDARGIDLISSKVSYFLLHLSPSDTSIGDLYHKAGVLCYINSNYVEAISWFNKAIVIRERTISNNVEPLLNTLNGLTQSHLQLFHYDIAENFIEQQLTLTQTTNYKNTETKAELYLADAQLALLIEDYSRCREKLNLAANIFEEVNANSFNHGLVLNLLGVTTDLLNKPERAIEYYQRSINIFQLNQEAHHKALSFHNLGMAYARLKKYNEAKYYLKESLQIHQSFNDTIEMARHYIEMAKIESSNKEYENAHQSATKSLLMRENVLPKWHIDVIESQVVLGKILMEMGANKPSQKTNFYDKAMKLFNASISAAIESPRTEWAIEPMINKAILGSKLGEVNIQKSKEAHRLFQQVDSIIQISRLKFRHQESKIDFASKIRHSYESAIKNSLHLFSKTKEKKYFEDALIFCEKSKATAVRDKLHKQAVQIYAGLPDSILKQERKLNLQLGALTQEILTSRSKQDTSSLTQLKTLEDIKHQMEEFDERVESNYPRYYQWLKEPIEKTSLAQIQKTLEHGSVLVEYFMGDDEIYIFGASKDKYQFWIVENTKQVITQLNLFNQTIENSVNLPISRTNEIAFKTYEILLAKPIAYFEEKDEVKNIKIVPDGIIGKVPFDALLTSNYKESHLDPPYLIKKYSHNFLYSNRLLLNSEHSKKTIFREKSSAIFGVDYLGNKKLFGDSIYSSLPFIKEEVSGFLNQNKGAAYINEDATVDNLEGRLTDTEILHIAIHGSFNEENPETSGLIFSKKNTEDLRNNFISLAAIYGLHTNAELVYLSACFSGKGNLETSEGVMSLSRAFTYAGAKSQVITLWEVSDRASAIIAEHFYSFLKEGNTKDNALRLAKLKYMEESSTSVGKSPFFWAGLVVVGDAKPLYVNAIIYKWILLLTIILVVIILIFAYRKKYSNKRLIRSN